MASLYKQIADFKIYLSHTCRSYGIVPHQSSSESRPCRYFDDRLIWVLRMFFFMYFWHIWMVYFQHLNIQKEKLPFLLWAEDTSYSLFYWLLSTMWLLGWWFHGVYFSMGWLVQRYHWVELWEPNRLGAVVEEGEHGLVVCLIMYWSGFKIIWCLHKWYGS